MSFEKLQEVVAKAFDISVDHLNQRSRKTTPSLARHVCIYYCRKALKLKVEKIGELFGRHHSLVPYAVTKVEGFMTYDLKFIERIKAIESTAPELKQNL